MARSPMNKDIKLYVSEDKSMKTVKMETKAKKLLRAFKATHPDKEVHLVRRTGTISVSWVQVARIDAKSMDDVQVLWNASAVAELGIAKANVMEKFGAADGGGSDVTWTL